MLVHQRVITRYFDVEVLGMDFDPSPKMSRYRGPEILLVWSPYWATVEVASAAIFGSPINKTEYIPSGNLT